MLYMSRFNIDIYLNVQLTCRGSICTLEQLYLLSYFAYLRWINLTNLTTLSLKYTTWREEFATKLISDYNTMDIWDFNEKYGDLWDFTLKKDDITKR